MTRYEDGYAAVEIAETYAATIEPPPCPSWCAEESGHAYGCADPVGRSASREHAWSGDNKFVVVEQFESIDFDYETVSLDVVAIFVNSAAVNDHLTGAAARSLAAELLNAADKLDEIQAAQR